MELLTIGSFARLSRLSLKALRLYDDLGLLPPAQVDPVSGYRLYHREQLERARLVAWLRRLGMPLAEIRVITSLEPKAAADAVASYWARCEADAVTRRDLAAFLIDYLSGGQRPPGEDGAAMPGADAALKIRYAARTDPGLQRERNEDVAYASARLLAVADGFGESGGGDLASAAVVDALKPLGSTACPGDLLNLLGQAVQEANDALCGIVEAEPAVAGIGSTLTAMLWSGSRLALVHIGDSRAYLLRQGELFQITHDHSYVQSLVDAGQLSLDEAASHPQRSLLLRALDGSTAPAADLSWLEAEAGDRYLLCSDGLSAVVPAEGFRLVLAASPQPDEAVRRLIDLANEGGGPDNIACVVADVVEREPATNPERHAVS
jgi:PPM family protein phosphatase